MIHLKSISKTHPIHNIDENIFTTCYYTRCMQSDCQDACCSYGCPMDTAEVERIMAYKKELEQRLGKDAAQWFVDGIEANADYPSGQIRRTTVYNGNCVFHDWSSRGCLLHRMALEKGLNPREMKPMVCFFFPLTWDGDYLHVAEYLDELPCKRQGESILDSIKYEIKYYLGEEVAAEIELLKSQF